MDSLKVDMYLSNTTSVTSCGSKCYRLFLQAFVVFDCVDE